MRVDTIHAANVICRCAPTRSICLAYDLPHPCCQGRVGQSRCALPCTISYQGTHPPSFLEVRWLRYVKGPGTLNPLVRLRNCLYRFLVCNRRLLIYFPGPDVLLAYNKKRCSWLNSTTRAPRVNRLHRSNYAAPTVMNSKQRSHHPGCMR